MNKQNFNFSTEDIKRILSRKKQKKWKDFDYNLKTEIGRTQLIWIWGNSSFFVEGAEKFPLQWKKIYSQIKEDFTQEF